MRKDGYGKNGSFWLAAGWILFMGLLGTGVWYYREFRVRQPAAASPKIVAVHVAGEVAHPGLYRIAETARVGDAVELAGGLTPDSDVADINLASRIRDGQKIVIPGRKNILERIGLGRAPSESYIVPPLEVRRQED